MNSPFRIVFVFIVLSFLGVACLPYLSIDLFPKTQSNILKISAGLPNSSPLILESQIIQVLENAVSAIPGIHEVSSLSKYDHGTIEIKFDKGTDMDMAAFELATIIRRIYPNLPSTASYPIFERPTDDSQNELESDRPILVYSINAPEQSYAIKSKSQNLFNKEFSSFTDIKEIRLTGTEDLQCSIEFDRAACLAYGISSSSIAAEINNTFAVSYPGTYHNIQGNEYFLKLASPAPDITALENLILPNLGRPIKLKNIARVFLEEQPIQSYYRVNGKNSIHLMFFARDGSNRLITADAIKQKMNGMTALLPAGYDIRTVRDETVYLSSELNKNYRRSFMALAILIVFLLISYRSWKYLFVLIISLMINLALTALVCYLIKIPIHLYSIAGLAISFGIMIDNSIVSLDYFKQYRNRHLFLAVLGATLTTIAALLLVYLLPNDMKQNLTDFAAMVSIALAVSLAVSLWFTPSLYLLFYPGHQKNIEELHSAEKYDSVAYTFLYKLIAFLARFRKSFIWFTILLFGLPVFLLPAVWTGHEYYNKTIGSTLYQEHLKSYIDKALGGSLRLFIRDVYEKSGYRDPQRTRLYVSAQMKYGTTVSQMNTILSQFEKYLVGIEGIDQYVTSIYSGQNGTIEISFLENFETSLLPWQLKSRLTAKATDWSAVEWGIFGIGQGFSTYGNDQIPSFQVLMKGYNNDELEKQALLLKQKLMLHPRVQKVNTNERLSWDEKSSWEYLLALNENQLAARDLDKNKLFSAIESISQTGDAGLSVQLKDKSYPLVLREKNSLNYDLWDMKYRPLSIDSQSIKLNEVTDLNLVATASALHKIDRQYIRLVAFEYLGSSHFGSKYLDKVLDETKMSLPLGYSAERKTWQWGRGVKDRPYYLLLLMILANYFICALLFESLRLPLYIILMIPLSFVGLFLIFSWGDFYFDQGGYAAFVMLAGLVVNAAIFIVHDYLQALKTNAHQSPNSILINAVTNRARTIILTTLSSICSLLPFIWEGQKEVFWFSLAVGVMGGLVFSMFAVFIVLPVLVWNKRF